MIIIKKGKSNWRYIWIVVISAVTLGGGALIYQYLNTEGLEEISIYHFFVKEKPDYTDPNRELSDKELLRYAKSPFNKGEMMFKNIIIGKHNGIPVRVTFPCSDICPGNTMRVIRYDVDIPECENIGGLVKTIFIPRGIALMPEEFCFPKPIVENNIYEFLETL